MKIEVISEGLSPKDLPGDLELIAEVIGVESTIKLTQEFRGCNIYIRNIDNIIRAKRNDAIREDYDAGVRIIELARKYKMSTRNIEIILSS